jgi:hypothetical protein
MGIFWRLAIDCQVFEPKTNTLAETPPDVRIALGNRRMRLSRMIFRPCCRCGEGRFKRRSVGRSVSRSLAAIEQDVEADDAPVEPDGSRPYRRLKTALEDIEEAKLQVSHRRFEPSAVAYQWPNWTAALHLVPATAAFLKIHPKIEVEVSTYDMSISSKTTDIHIGAARPGGQVLPTSFLHQTTSPTHGRNTRKIFQSITHVRTHVGADIWPFTVEARSNDQLHPLLPMAPAHSGNSWP